MDECLQQGYTTVSVNLFPFSACLCLIAVVLWVMKKALNLFISGGVHMALAKMNVCTRWLSNYVSTQVSINPFLQWTKGLQEHHWTSDLIQMSSSFAAFKKVPFLTWTDLWVKIHYWNACKHLFKEKCFILKQRNLKPLVRVFELWGKHQYDNVVITNTFNWIAVGFKLFYMKQNSKCLQWYF